MRHSLPVQLTLNGLWVNFDFRMKQFARAQPPANHVDKRLSNQN